MLARTPDTELDSGPRRGRAGAERFCALTRTVKPVEDMIRRAAAASVGSLRPAPRESASGPGAPRRNVFAFLALSVAVLALVLPADRIAERVRRRVDRQFEGGLLDEIRGLLARGVPEDARPFGGLVYRQALEHLHGVRGEAATRDLIAQENRRYARRQLIWFRKEPNLQWFDAPGESPSTIAAARALLDRRLKEIGR